MSQTDFSLDTSGQPILASPSEAAIYSDSGDDIYQWAPADGDLRISDMQGIDVLYLNGPAGSFVFTVDGSHASLIVHAADHTLTIAGYFQNGHVETVKFSDGAEWHLNEVKGALIIETPPPPPSQEGMLILGAAGNERLIGGIGADILAGGKGKDIFVFGKSDTSLGKNRDIIVDFMRSEDRIDLKAIDANNRTKADDAFGKLLFSKQKFTDAGQMRYEPSRASCPSIRTRTRRPSSRSSSRTNRPPSNGATSFSDSRI